MNQSFLKKGNCPFNDIRAFALGNFNLSKYVLLLLVLLVTLKSNSQRLQFDWNPKPTIHSICVDSFKTESAIILLEKIQLIYEFDEKGVTGSSRKVHKIVKVNDDKGIEMFNKIKISYRSGYPITDIKARCILPSGKIVELKPEAFKDQKDEDGTLKKLFAMEGIEKGAEIEYMYSMKQPIKFNGEYVLQDYFPTCISEFEILTPKHLIFELKGYQNVQMEKDSMFDKVNSFYARSINLIGLKEEKMASYNPHFARVNYSLAYNTATKGSNVRILTWDEAAKSLHKRYFEVPEKDIKEVKKLLSQDKDYAKCQNNSEKQEWIENYIKSNYIENDNIGKEDAESIPFILKYKSTTKYGIIQLFVAMFLAENIPFDFGFTTNRLSKPFDYSFANWDNLDECVMYFPDTKRYMAPNESSHRIPFIPSGFCNNDAMFCKILKLGSVSTAMAEKRTIPEFKAEQSFHDHDVDVVFSPKLDSTLINIKNTFGGFSAVDMLPLFIYLENEKRDEFAKQIIRLNDKEDKITNFKYENNEFSSLTKKKPLAISATIYATNNLEKAGDKYIFRIGELIGRQSELYQESPRQFDIDFNNPHQFTRHLNIKIPSGYKAINLDKLNINVIYKEGTNEICKFVSEYKLNGDMLSVTIFEVYHTSHVSKKYYSEYSKVVNAAADFNKVVILFEKI